MNDYDLPTNAAMNIPAPLAHLYTEHGSVAPFALPPGVQAQYQSQWHYRLLVTTARGRTYAACIHVDRDLQELAHELANGWIAFYPWNGEQIIDGRTRRIRMVIPNVTPTGDRQ